MNFVLIFKPDGTKVRYPATPDRVISTKPGDEVVLIDHKGQPADVDLRAEEEDLIVSFEDDLSVTLQDFNLHKGEGDPVTIGIKPPAEAIDTYEFNSQVGNLPGEGRFSLMRYSSIRGIGFEDPESGRLGLFSGMASTDFMSPTPEDKVPNAMPDQATTTEDSSTVIDLLANDVDPEGGGFQIVAIHGVSIAVGESVTLPSGSRVTLNEDGTVSYEPGDDFDALGEGDELVDTFSYSIIDQGGNVVSSTASVTVAGQNDPPVAVDDYVRGLEDQPIYSIPVLSNDSDPDGDSLSIVGLPSAANGVVVVNPNGTLNYIPNPDFNGEDEITYTITDPNGETSTATVTVVVEAVNDPPVANPDVASVDEDTLLTNVDLIVNDTDKEGDALNLVGTPEAENGTVVVNPDGTINYTPDPDFNGEDVVTYIITDPSGATSTSTLTVTVNPVNDPPVGVDDDATTDEDSPIYNLNVLGNDTDVDGDPLSIQGTPTAISGTVSVNPDGTLNYTPDLNFNGTDTITYIVTDGNGESDTATVTVTVNPVNDAPVAVDDTGSGAEDTDITGNVITNDTDVDGDTPLTVLSNTDPSNGTLVLAADGSYTYTPDANFNGTDTFTYVVQDPSGATDTATVTLTVNPVNDAPVAVDDTGSVNEDAALVVNAASGLIESNDSDIDGDTLNVTAIRTGPEAGAGTAGTVGTDLTGTLGTLNVLADGSFDYTADQAAADTLAVGESAVDTFTYTISDGAGGTDTAEVVFTVIGTNDGPVAVNDTGAVDEDATLVVNATSGVIQSNDTDLDASDTLEVTAIRTGAESGTGTGALVGNDLVGTYGTLTMNDDGSYSYAADQAAANGLPVGQMVTDTFTYTISDGNGGTDTAELTITVTGTNDGPIANPPGGTPGVDPGVYNDTDTVAEDTVAPITGDVLANDLDPDGDTLTVSSIDGSAVTAMTPAMVVGTYGTITQNGDGTYSYALDNTNPTVQALAVGETTTETFTYTASDGNGGTADADLVITITGTNDVPIANPPGGTPGVDFGVYDDVNAIGEDAFPNSATGNVLSNDLDPDGDMLTVSEVNGMAANTGATVTGTYGSITINSDGSYNYALDNTNSTVQALGVGQSTTETFTYTASDGNGGTATATLRITINGTNDAPIANPSGGTPGVDFGVYDDTDTVAEDTVAPITGDVLANDLDPDGDTLVVSQVNGVAGNVDNALVGTYGTITLDSDGSYSYALDNTNPVVQALAVGETTIETFTYTANDGNGGTADADLVITITGTNDVPVANPMGGTPGVDFGVYDDTNAIAEDTVAPITGDVLSNDLDPDGDTLTVSAVNGVAGNVDNALVGTYGTITLNSDGSYSYALDNTNPTVQALGVSQSTTETFTYTANDGNGGTATASLVITITGTNDGPVAVDDTGSGAEDTDITGNVITNDTDVDGDTPLTVLSNTDPSNGTLVLAANGAYTYTPDANFNGTDTFTYVVQDPSGATDTATVTLTVNPANDPPVAVDDTGSVNEDAALVVNAANGLIESNDSDLDGDTLNVTAIRTGPEAGAGTAGTVGTDLTGTLGTLNVLADGSFDYTADQAAADTLAVGESAVDTFTYTISDGAGGTDTAEVVFTVIGTNDGPVAVNDIGAVDEDATLVVNAASGVIQSNDTDLDATDTLEVTAIRTGAESGTGTGAIVGNDLVGTYGTLTMNDDGSYSYAADQAAANALPVGQMVTDTFTYTISDGNGGTDTAELVITVTGTNDAPIANPPGGTPGVDVGVYDDTDTVAEDTVAPITGDVLANDLDPDGDTLTVSSIDGSAVTAMTPAMVVGTYGTITQNEDGTYSYALDNTNSTVQALAVGETTTETFTYTANDGNGGTADADLVITITGTNDVPVANPMGGTPGVDFGVYDDANAISEDTVAPITGDVLSNDLDPDGDTLTVSAVNGVAGNVDNALVGTYGTITLNSDGSYSYALDNTNPTVQALGVSQSTTETFTYTANDGNGGTATASLVITITGTNDGPVAVDDTGSGAEDTDIAGNVITNDTDVDGDTPLTVLSNTDPSNGTLVIAANGAYTYTPDANFNGTDTFTYVVQDPSGATDTATVTLTVNPANDPPVAVDDTGSVNEDAALVVNATNGLIESNDSDLDGDTLNVTAIRTGSEAGAGTAGTVGSDLTGTLGTLNVLADGSFDYTADQAAADTLAVGESAVDTFTYTISDGAGGTDTAEITVVVTGTNDGPVAVNDIGAVDEDATLVVNAASGVIQSNDTDLDASDTLEVTAIRTGAESGTGTGAIVGNDLVGTYGTLTMNDDGSYSYAADQAAANALPVGQMVTDTFTYTISDGNGGTDTAELVITVTGTNDAPIANPPGGTPGVDPGVYDDTDTVAEDTVAPITGDVLANDLDPDGDTLTVSSIDGSAVTAMTPAMVVGTYGTITQNGDGTYSYALDNTNSTVQALAVGETTTETFTYTANDGNGGTADADLVITITGTNDAPIANPMGGTPGVDPGVYDDTDTVAEDTVAPITGDVLANDLDPDGDTLTVSSIDGSAVTAMTPAMVVGTYGTITQNGDGTYSYALDNTNSTVQALAVGETTTETFTYTANDGNGGTADADLVITITGTNDAPIANPPGGTPGVDPGVYDDTDTVAEDTVAPITGDVLANDLDPDGDTLTVSTIDGSAVTAMTPAMVVGTYGTITQNEDGTYSYALDNTNPTVQALAVGETTTETFTYTANDGNGGTADADLVITITGTNDAPIANPPMGTPGVDFGVYDDTNSIAEDLPVPVTGNVLTNDLDPDGDTLTVSAVNGVVGNVDNALVGTYGTITLNSDGSYSYELDNTNPTIQALGVSQSTTEIFTYTANDGNGGTATATLTITITGTNDGPVAVDDTGSGAENTDITGNVITNDTDVDGDTPLTVLSNTDPSNGTLVIAANGSYTYTPDANFNGTDTFTYVVQDPSGATDTATVTLTVNPANDPPVAVDDTGSVNEDAALVVNATNGLIESNDSDLDGDTLNVIAIRTGSESGTGTAGTVGTDLTGTLGTLNVLADGSFDYTADQAAADTLAVGESAVDTFTYTISDGAGGTDTAEVVFTVIGTNDGPVAVNDTGAVDEEGTLVVNASSGVIETNDTDLDASDTLEVTAIRTGSESGTGTGALVGNALTGTYGTLTMNDDGSYSYVADQASANALALGVTATDTFTYTVNDGNGGTDTAELTITITGTDDPSEITVGMGDSDTGAVTEDVDTDAMTGGVQLEQSGTLTVTDADTSDTAAFDPTQTVLKSTTHTGPLGALSIDAAGAWDYSVDNASVQFLDAGETITEIYTVESTDGQTHDITITITGADDPSEITVGMGDSDTGAVTEDVDTDAMTGGVQLEQSGTLTVTDADTSDTAAFDPTQTVLKSTTHTGPLGALSIDAAGAWDYSVDNASVQFLDAGETITEIYTVESTDGQTHDITITITGADDPSEITVGMGDSDTGAVTEDVDTDAMTGGVQLEQNGTLTVTDADTSDTAAFDPMQTVLKSTTHTGPLGSLSINAAGAWDYSVDNASVQFLDAGESITEIYTVESTDGTTHDITITINGADENSAPTLSSDVTSGLVYESGLAAGTGTAPTTTSVTGTLSSSDPDGDALTVRVNGSDLGVLDGNVATVLGSVAGEDGSGSLTVYGDGSWKYDLLNEAVHDGDDSTYVASEMEQFAITLFDGTAESAPVNLTFNIVDDQVVLGTPDPGSVENTSGESFTGSLGVTGADSADASLTGSIPGWDGMTTTFGSTALTSTGEPVYYFVDPADESILIAYTDTSGAVSGYDPSNPNQTLVFTVEARPGTDDYELILSQPIDITDSLLIDFGVLSASGPQYSYRFTDAPSLLSPSDPIPPGETVVFSAYGIDPTDKVNSNASYMGLNNNLVNPNEAGLVVDFVAEGRSVTIGYAFNGGGSNTMISWVAYGVDDMTVVASGTYDAGGVATGTFEVEHNWTKLGKVEISSFDSNTKAFRISSISVEGADSTAPLDLTFPVTVTDQDGDSDSASISVSFENPTTPPIVIDLDGDGAEFNSIDEGIFADVDGDGELEQTAWANEDDGVLIYDGNDNNQVDGRGEFAFADYSEDPNATDLEGLRHFDSNDDLILDANDEEFDAFKIWQDADGDGQVTEGEMISLTEAGIESIELTSDGVGYDAADGDVYVHGEATVHYADGSTGIAADAEFNYAELVDQSGEAPLEVVSESGEVVSLSEADSAGALGTSVADSGEIVVPESSPTASIDEQTANDVAMQ